MSRLALLLLVLTARVAAAHDVPIPPSTCTFAQLSIAFPFLGQAGVGVAPAPADALTIVYVPGRQVAQFNAATVPPRALTGLGSSATLALPAIFEARTLGTGDLTAADVPLVVTVDGTEATVTVTLTTGLAAAGDVYREGVPLDGESGGLALIGVATTPGLPGALDGATAVFHLACVADPVPDLDQYPVVTTKGPTGEIAKHGLRLKATVKPGAVTPDFAGLPAVLQVTAGDAVLATVAFPDGLPADGGRTFVARTEDGAQQLKVRLVRRRPVEVYTLAVKVRAPLPSLGSGRQTVALSYRVGGLLARTARPFRRAAGKLHAP